MGGQDYTNEFWCLIDRVLASSIEHVGGRIPREENDPIISFRGCSMKMIQYTAGFAVPSVFLYPVTLIPWSWYTSYFIEWSCLEEAYKEPCLDYLRFCPDAPSLYARGMVGIDLATYAAHRSAGLTQVTRYRGLLDAVTGNIGERAHKVEKTDFRNILDLRPAERIVHDFNSTRVQNQSLYGRTDPS